MRVWVKNSGKIQGRRDKLLGEYADIVIAVREVYPRAKWLTARRAIWKRRHKSETVEIFIGQNVGTIPKGPLSTILLKLAQLHIDHQLYTEISNALVRPSEQIEIVIFNGVGESLPEVLQWATARGWSVGEWPDGPALSLESTQQPHEYEV